MKDYWFAVPKMLMHSAAQTMTASGSPYVFTVPRDGAVIVTGGTVSLLEYGRDTTYTSLGVVAGIIPVFRGDTIRVTYVVAPSLKFMPQ